MSNPRYHGGGTPYGLTRSKGGKLSPDPREQAAIMLAKAYHATGMTYRAIGNRLLADGYPPRTGGPWHATQIMRMLVLPADANYADAGAARGR